MQCMVKMKMNQNWRIETELEFDKKNRTKSKKTYCRLPYLNFPPIFWSPTTLALSALQGTTSSTPTPTFPTSSSRSPRAPHYWDHSEYPSRPSSRPPTSPRFTPPRRCPLPPPRLTNLNVSASFPKKSNFFHFPILNLKLNLNHHQFFHFSTFFFP